MGSVGFMVWSLLFSRGGLLGVVLLMRTVTTVMTMVNDDNHCEGSPNLFMSPKWLSQPFGMTAFGFCISAGIPFVPSSLALPADKSEYRDAN